jgi:pimeloyl-ACP methyl ester carboxylesterase
VTLDDELARFRAEHPPVEHVHAGRTWRYTRGGSGAETVLHLTGVLGNAELGFQQIAAYERRFRVLAPDYAPVGSLDEMVAGIVSLLDAEKVEQAHVVAGSFGGMVAQSLVRRHPRRVRSLVLSHTTVPQPANSGPRRTAALLGLLPGPLVRSLFRRRLRGSFAAADPFWTRFFDASSVRMPKGDILSRLRVAADFAEERYGPHDLDGWPGRILVLDADADPLFPEARQRAVRALYPPAVVHTFRGTGHAAAILNPEGYATVILDFLGSSDAAH